MTAKFRSKSTVSHALASALVAAVLLGESRAAAQLKTPPQPPKREGEYQWAPEAVGVDRVPGTSGLTAGSSEYVIGALDVLGIVYWRDKDMTLDTTVRPDGKITMPLLNEVQAAGLTPRQLREQLIQASKQFMEDPNVAVIVREINSRKAYITGQVEKPGSYPLNSPTTVIQLIAMAGGLKEFADGDNIMIIRNEKEGQISYRFSYKGLTSRKVSLATNILLKSGDTVVVP
jgi:polysaccharide biosynthesis/export protein